MGENRSVRSRVEMKLILKIFVFLFLLNTDSLNAQESEGKRKIFSLHIWTKENNVRQKYLFGSVTDTSVIVIKESDYQKLKKKEQIMHEEIPVSDIRRISVLRKRKVIEPLLTGAAAGLAAGAATAAMGVSASEPEYVSKTAVILISAASGLVMGASQGWIIGLLRSNYQINGDIEKFQDFKKKFQNRNLI
jgi:hypothetical protein